MRFSPAAWAKLLWLRDRGPTEVGGFAISAADDLLRIDQLQLIPQQATALTVELDDQAVADYFDRCVDQGLTPAQFARIWVHTHPGNSPQPSSTDEETFARCFGTADWALMFILARGGASYARLRFNTGPGAALELPVEIDYQAPFAGTDEAAWEREYLASVRQAIAVSEFETHAGATRPRHTSRSRARRFASDNANQRDTDDSPDDGLPTSEFDDFLPDRYFNDPFYSDPFYTGSADYLGAYERDFNFS